MANQTLTLYLSFSYSSDKQNVDKLSVSIHSFILQAPSLFWLSPVEVYGVSAVIPVNQGGRDSLQPFQLCVCVRVCVTNKISPCTVFVCVTNCVCVIKRKPDSYLWLIGVDVNAGSLLLWDASLHRTRRQAVRHDTVQLTQGFIHKTTQPLWIYLSDNKKDD